MKKTLPIFIALILVVSGGAFYGGMKYQQSKSSLGNFSRQNFQNLSEEQRQQMFQGNAGASLGQGIGSRGAGSGFLSGEVIAKDNQSLTLKMTDGSSKIIFFSGSTEISKTAQGTANDIEIGKQIMITGEQNSDGSYTAKTIQLSPSSMMR
ncbi:MAG: hypothetical protein ABIG29_00930 [Candidatus Nealsonbacteria bacterium]